MSNHIVVQSPRGGVELGGVPILRPMVVLVLITIFVGSGSSSRRAFELLLGKGASNQTLCPPTLLGLLANHVPGLLLTIDL